MLVLVGPTMAFYQDIVWLQQAVTFFVNVCALKRYTITRCDV